MEKFSMIRGHSVTIEIKEEVYGVTVDEFYYGPFSRAVFLEKSKEIEQIYAFPIGCLENQLKVSC